MVVSLKIMQVALVIDPRATPQKNESERFPTCQGWVDSVKSVTSRDFLTQSSQVTSHTAPVDSVKSRCRAVTVTVALAGSSRTVVCTVARCWSLSLWESGERSIAGIGGDPIYSVAFLLPMSPYIIAHQSCTWKLSLCFCMLRGVSASAGTVLFSKFEKN